jgi:ATP-dependent Clp protease ATP-binding subunit ClpA
MNNFTPRAQQTLALARKEAERLNHNYVATEHLLLGLTKLGQGVAVNVLQKMGLDLETIRMEVEKQFGSGPETKVVENVPYTPRFKKVLALAGKEAKSLNHSHVGTEHLLLGLLREGEGVAARVLNNLEVDIERTRTEILKELDPDFTPKAQPDATVLLGSPQTAPVFHFAPRAQQVLAIARREAERLGHQSVDTEHLLLGIIKLGQDIAFIVLQKMGVLLEIIGTELELHSASKQDLETKGPFTPRVKKVLALAGKEARSLNHSYIGTEHLLLGILREGEGVAALALKNHGASVERARNEILKELDPNLTPGASSSPQPPTATRSALSFAFTVSYSASPSPEQPTPAQGQTNFWRARFVITPNFTPRAMLIWVLAWKEADRLHHNYVGSEHLLLALIRLEEGGAVDCIRKLGLDLDTIRAEVEKQVGCGPESNVAEQAPIPPRSKKLLAFAIEEARSTHCRQVGTEHILLGLLREGEGLAVRALENLGVDLERARNEIRMDLDPICAESSRQEGTPRAERALFLAHKEANRFHHNYVGTEHLLLGLIAVGEGVAVNALQKMGLGLEAIQVEVEKQITRGPESEVVGYISYTTRSRRVLRLAAQEAKSLNHARVGTGHILLGLLREGGGVAVRALENLGMEIEPARNAVLGEIDSDSTPPPTSQN